MILKPSRGNLSIDGGVLNKTLSLSNLSRLHTRHCILSMTDMSEYQMPGCDLYKQRKMTLILIFLGLERKFLKF